MDLDRLIEKLREIGYNGSKPGDDKVIQAMTAVILSLEMLELSDHEKRTILDLLTESSQNQIQNLPAMSENRWEDFNYGNVKFGDFVRVKNDAYDSDTGKFHNGLVGILSAGSGGRFLVNYIGLRAGTSMRHPMGMLESLKLR